MSAHNNVTLMGRLTKDPEVKFTTGELCIANFSLAVDGRKRDDDASFIDCTAFGKTAELIKQYFEKGKAILINGALRQERWEDKNSGQGRSKIIVIVEGFAFLPGGKAEGGAAPAEVKRTTVHRSEVPPQADGDEPPF